jgi:hypothetical protein
MNRGAEKRRRVSPLQIVGGKKRGPAETKRQLILCTLVPGAINPWLLAVGLVVTMLDSIFFQRQPFVKLTIEALSTIALQI